MGQGAPREGSHMKISQVRTRTLTDEDHARFAIANERLGTAQEAWAQAQRARPFDKAAEVTAFDELRAAEKALSIATR